MRTCCFTLDNVRTEDTIRDCIADIFYISDRNRVIYKSYIPWNTLIGDWLITDKHQVQKIATEITTLIRDTTQIIDRNCPRSITK